MKYAFPFLSTCWLFASCTQLIGPNHTLPTMQVPDRWSSGGTGAKSNLTAAWWRNFGDAELNRLEDLALNANQDIIAAMHRIDEAEASLRISRADLSPVLDAGASARRNRQSANSNQIGIVTADVVSNYNLANNLNYELDLWGKVRRATESKKASLAAIQYAQDAVRLRLTAQVAEQYYALRTLDAEHRVLLENIQLRHETLRIARTRHEGGLTTEIDVTRATSALASAEADAADVTRRRDLLSNTIAELCGQAASDFKIAKTTKSQNLIPEAPLDSPATILCQRPDVAEAERTLAARSAEIGIAMGERLPSVKLNGNLSLESLTLGNLLTQGSRAFSLGPELSLPLFSAGASEARVKQAQSKHQQAAAEWKGVVVAALKEVEDALANQRGYAEIATTQNNNATAAARTTALSLERYKKGIVNYLEVVDAQREELQARRAQVQAHGHRLSSTVALIKAIGGS